MDFASSTPLHPVVARELTRVLTYYGNPSAPHKEGREARELLEGARTDIARTLSVKDDALLFTASGTESNNLAVFGVVEALVERGAQYSDLHIITSQFEHPSILEPIKVLEKKGVSVSYLASTHEGFITPLAVENALTKNTVLVSIVAVQSEIGTIQPLRDISNTLTRVRRAREQTMQHLAPESSFPIFHTDASQGSLFVDLSPDRLGVDMASYDGQKIMGPKGIGLLYKDSSVVLAPFLRGGSQERKLRPGTPNVQGAVGMARAFTLAVEKRKERAERVAHIRDHALMLIEKNIPHALVNGGVKNRIANNINISVPGTDGDYLAVLMDSFGVSISPRSACIVSGELSHSVASLGRGADEAQGTLRFSFAPDVSKDDVRFAVQALTRAVALVDSKLNM